MAYTDSEWNDVLAFLNNNSEFTTPEEFIAVIREVEAIKPKIVNSNSHNKRDFSRVQTSKNAADQAVIDLQDELDNHPGNPN